MTEQGSAKGPILGRTRHAAEAARDASHETRTAAEEIKRQVTEVQKAIARIEGALRRVEETLGEHHAPAREVTAEEEVGRLLLAYVEQGHKKGSWNNIWISKIYERRPDAVEANLRGAIYLAEKILSLESPESDHIGRDARAIFEKVAERAADDELPENVTPLDTHQRARGM
ncbi:hypothetical protein ACIBK1_05755 [Microbispora rosea]|uniref:Uncharacterized protein n=1 Tax=Microbispora cellulosiformans TaxID=2614688 RepID=A0A5J5K0J2_9ACTN|nr:hypothetical protein [Microbispora cellulosiformans]KAA9376378.1 hypothetical protein F5972_23425 [Microbispora cellulosiformans]